MKRRGFFWGLIAAALAPFAVKASQPAAWGNCGTYPPLRPTRFMAITGGLDRQRGTICKWVKFPDDFKEGDVLRLSATADPTPGRGVFMRRKS